MSTKHLLFWGSVVAFAVLVYAAGAQAPRLLPGSPASLHLAVLLVFTKALADVLELPHRPRRPTFYLADYIAEWLHFGLLGLVAVGAHALATALVGRPVGITGLAIGVYLVWRATAPGRQPY